ncbi:MAG TPA: hypothetical protein VH539_20410 [Gemmatimonadaceae bacterium]|jgi:hypothetical protein
MRSTRKAVSIAFGLLLLLLIAPLAWSQKLAVVVPPKAAVYDTVVATATAYDVTGRRSPSSKVTWVTRPSGSIVIKPDSATKGQLAKIIAIAPGGTYAIAIWARSDGKIVRDSGEVEIGPPLPVSTQPFFGVRLTEHGLELVTSRTDATKGLKGCIYTVQYDRAHNPMTGIPVTYRSTNTAVAIVNGEKGNLPSECPDTTVDPLKLPAVQR